MQTTQRARTCRGLLLPLVAAPFAALFVACSSPVPTAAVVQARLSEHLQNKGIAAVSVQAAGADQFTGTATASDGAVFNVTASAGGGMLRYELRSSVAARTTEASGTTSTSASESVIAGSFMFDD